MAKHSLTFLLLGIATVTVQYLKASDTNGVGHRDPTQAQVSPVPPYPASGVVPPALDEQYVFKDLATGDLVLSYPPDLLGTDVPVSGVMEGGRVKQIVYLPNKVDPFIYVTIGKADNELVYGYAVTNRAGSKQPIVRWGIDSSATTAFTTGIAEPATGQMVRSPAGWQCSRQGALAQWASVSGSIASGETREDFAIRSNLKPGFVLAFASSSADSSLPVGEVPAAVAKQIEALRPFAMDRQLALTIGPKYSASTPESAVVSDFLSGVEILVRNRYLSEDSPLVQQLHTQLEAYLRSLNVAPNAPADEVPRFSLQLTSKPQNNLERQIVDALRVSLEDY